MKTQYRTGAPRRTTRPDQQDRLAKHLTRPEALKRARLIKQILDDPALGL